MEEEEGLGLQDAKRLELTGGVGIGETVGMGRGFGIACKECLSVNAAARYQKARVLCVVGRILG